MGGQRLEQKQYQSLNPQQIQFLGLLQIPVVLLEKRIEEEMEENPALDEDEEIEEEQASFRGSDYSTGDQDFQIEDKTESLKDYLIKQLVGLNLEAEDVFLVKYLINSLDDNGFLGRDLYSISSDLLTNNNQVVPEGRLQLALTILQGLEPKGVGAKDLQECLLLQLQKAHPSEKTAFQIISDHYTPFSNKNFEFLIKNLLISEKQLKAIYNLIESLNPIPSAGFSENSMSGEYIYPDFVVIESNNQLQLQLNKGNSKKLRVSKYYSDLLLETNDEKTKDFLQKKIEKAKWFRDSMEKRETTLRRVMEAIIQLQKAYLISGADQDLRPMKLADVASIVRLDISTISRVSNSKYIETHFGTFKVKELFSDAYRKDNGKLISTNEIKTKLKALVLQEDKLSPFTDEQLAELLGKEEYHIARRTVAKYREQLGIKTAKLRRQL